MKNIVGPVLLLCAVFLLFLRPVHAQEGDTLMAIKASLEVQAQYKNGRVDLRWAPNAYYTFSVARKNGYAIERYNPGTGRYELLDTLRPYTLAEFKAKLDTTNLYVTTAAQALWGQPGPVLNGNPLEAAKARAEEQNNRFVFALLAAEFNQQAATGLALYYQDRNVAPNQVYAYRIYALNVDKKLLTIDTAGVSVNTYGSKTLRPVLGLFAEGLDGKIKLQWPRNANNDRFSGYFIERQGKGEFQRLNTYPHISSAAENENIFNVFIDTNAENGQTYRYRVIGINSFAELSPPSAEITAQAKDRQGPIPPRNLTVNHEQEGQFTLRWEAISSESDHAGFLVARASDGMGPFVILTEKPLSKNRRSWTDESPPLIDESYYLVYAVDQQGNRNASGVAIGQWRDSIPPAKPENLIGYADSTGVVMLAWALGGEPDLYGYKVFAGTARNREFYQVNSLVVEGNIFLDKVSLKTLSEDIYYYVTALDYRSNASLHSDTIKIEKPDTIPPSPVVFTDYQLSPDSISFSWVPSSSHDVAAYYLLRKNSGNEEYALLDQLDLQSTTYSDTAVRVGESYVYAVLAVDDDGGISLPRTPLQLSCVDRGLRPGINDLKGALDAKNGRFELSWTPPADSGATVQVYRNDNEEGLELLAQLKAAQSSFVDGKIYNNEGRFDYALKVLYPDGGASGLSNVVSLKLK